MNADEFEERLASMERKERILIGYLLHDADAPAYVIKEKQLDRRVFFFAETRIMYLIICEMYNAGLEINGATVAEYMMNTGTLREISGINAINDYLFCKQYAEQRHEEYSLDYLLNMLTAGAEYREMYFLTSRYNLGVIMDDGEQWED